jgi:hypothetical protein
MTAQHASPARWLGVGAAAVMLAGSSGLVSPAVAGSSGGVTACVDGAGCHSTLSAALSAAGPGAVVRLSAGVFTGGVTIVRPVTLIGTGAGRTVITGGGPVITVEPTAEATRVVGVTITGGVTHGDGVEAFGGGVLVRAGSGDAPGASLTLSRSVVKGNRTEPTRTSPSPSGVRCPESDCPYAGSFGAGIATWGDLTLDRVRISDNLAGGAASDADGAGVWARGGDVVVRRSSVVRNDAVPREIGRFAEGAGLFVEGGSLDVDRSDVSHNRADLQTRWPVLGQGELIEMGAHAGGIHVGGGAAGTLITRSRINHNVVRTVDPVGEPLAFDAALLSHLTPLTMRDTEISHNRVISEVATTDDILPVGSVVEINAGGTVSDTRITDNSVTIHSVDGSAVGSSGLAVYDFVGNADPVDLTRVVVSGNRVRASSTHGSAGVLGVGIFNNTVLRARSSTVRDNAGTARAPVTMAQGGGIWNGAFLSGPPVDLALTSSRVVHNSVAATDASSAQGGGIYNAGTVTLERSQVAHNRPDDCFACDPSAPGPSAGRAARPGPTHDPLRWR